MATRPNYYEILKISRSATNSEIKQAYRRRAREVHPDVNPRPDAEERFKQVNDAYHILSDPRRRSVYDRMTAGGYSSYKPSPRPSAPRPSPPRPSAPPRRASPAGGASSTRSAGGTRQYRSERASSGSRTNGGRSEAYRPYPRPPSPPAQKTSYWRILRQFSSNPFGRMVLAVWLTVLLVPISILLVLGIYVLLAAVFEPRDMTWVGVTLLIMVLLACVGILVYRSRPLRPTHPPK